MKTHLQRALVIAPETLFHFARPDASCCAKLGYLFEEIVMGVKEERNPRHKAIYVQARFHTPGNIFDTVAQCERQLLNRSGPSFTDVIAAHRNRIVAGDVV